jgi:hypothetical protein
LPLDVCMNSLCITSAYWHCAGKFHDQGDNVKKEYY